MSEPSWPTFTDAAGDKWTIELNVALVQSLRKELDLDLLAIVTDKKILPRLATDDVLLVDAISLLLSESIETRKLDAEGFARRLFGDTLQAAAEAMVEAVAVFSRPQKRGLIRESWAAMATAETRVTRMALDKLPEIVDRSIEKARKHLETSGD